MQPPPVTPRQHLQQQQSAPIVTRPKSRSPSPSKQIVDDSRYIYLYEYCPLTLEKVKANRNHVKSLRKEMIESMNQDLDYIGIAPVNSVEFILRSIRFDSMNKILF